MKTEYEIKSMINSFYLQQMGYDKDNKNYKYLNIQLDELNWVIKDNLKTRETIKERIKALALELQKHKETQTIDDFIYMKINFQISALKWIIRE